MNTRVSSCVLVSTHALAEIQNKRFQLFPQRKSFSSNLSMLEISSVSLPEHKIVKYLFLFPYLLIVLEYSFPEISIMVYFVTFSFIRVRDVNNLFYCIYLSNI